MIDIEAEIFTKLAKSLREKFSGINITGEVVQAPAAFPHVSIVEQENIAYLRLQSTADTETHADLMYEINIYSNKKAGKKSECKAIFAHVDEIMTGIGFVRTMQAPVSNIQSPEIYRMVGRYKAVVSVGKTIYRR